MTLDSTEDLFNVILSRENLNAAWEHVRSNKGAAGIDGITINTFVSYFKEIGQSLVHSIRTGDYQPYPVKRVYIRKADGGERALGIPTVFDRVIQQAIAQVINPVFDDDFSPFSYGFRPKRSQHDLECREGVPQGSPLSPLLSNIVLDVLDKELEKRNHQFVRYADDFVIVVNSRRAGERVMASITHFVERKLKLKVNSTKSQVAPINQCKFLGFSFHGSKLVWHEKVLQQFKRRVKELTGRSRGISMEKKIRELTRYLRGWINYFGIAQGFQKCIDLDNWIRRRLRMSYWKSWRRVRTKVKNLLRMGVSEKLAAQCGSSNKSYWRSAKTAGIHIALNNEFFAKMGLISLKDRWVEIHYP